MKKKLTGFLSFLIALCVMISMVCAVPLTAGAEENPYFDSGTCGSPKASDVEWYTFNDGSIAVFGTGAMAAYPPSDPNTPASPWYTSRYLMASLTSTKVAIEDGVTAIGDYDFYLSPLYANFNQMVSVDLPESLTAIGAHAFENQTKLEKITIPLNVSTIGADALTGCTKLRHIDFYCDPTALSWADDSKPFAATVTCHINPNYQDKVDELNRKYKAKNVTFEANLYNGLINESDGIERNIKAYLGQETTSILGGAVPVVVVGTFSGQKKSVTHGSNGFATCVKIGSDYYVHTNNSSGHINKVTLNSTSGIITGVSNDYHDSLRVTVRIEYIGVNIAKVIYEIQNQGGSPVNDVMLGGTGDIKIGADDYAAIHPLTENSEQVGFYMTSRNEYDRSGDSYATLGFIGKGVEISKNGNESVTSEDATYFYGPVAANKRQSATGVYKHRLMPERVFTPGSSAQTEGDFNTGNTVDSGMSYYWNVGTLNAGQTKEYAVLFSVYGNNTTQQDGGQSMVTEKEKTYHTVTWQNYNNTDLLKQIVEEGTTPVYDGETPSKPADNDYRYVFSGWSPAVGACTADATYTAQFTQKPKFFAKHSLTLDDGNIGVNFYLDPAGADLSAEQITSGDKKIKIRFNWFDKTYTLTPNELIAPHTGTNSTDYFRATCRVAAAEMAYNIHAVAYINDVEFTKEYDDYSVKQYGETILNAPDGTYNKQGLLVDLVKKMLDYGAKAQVQFDRQKDIDGTTVPLANVNADYTMESHVIDGDAPVMTVSEDTGLKYYAVSMVFLSTTTIRHYYKVLDKDAFDKLSNRSDFKQNGTLYYLETEGIRADMLDHPYTFTVGSENYSYSGLDYARKLQGRSTTAEQNLGTATYWYSTAANAYFA